MGDGRRIILHGISELNTAAAEFTGFIDAAYELRATSRRAASRHHTTGTRCPSVATVSIRS